MRRSVLFPAAIATTTLLAAPAPADGAPQAPPQSSRSEDNKPAAWWVDTRPWTCARWARPLAEEIQLACDAGAGCAIASDERSATRRATLVCGTDERWTLEARDRSGRVLWTLSLDGSHEDRLRQAGVWVARSDMPDLPSLPADAPPPLATAAAEADDLPGTLAEPAQPAPSPPSAPPAAAAPSPPPVASDKPAAPHPPASAEPPQTGWFAFSASARLGSLRLFTTPASWALPENFGGSAAMGGLHGAAIAHSTHIYGGLSVVYEHSLTDLQGLSESLWQPGAVLGWGAPYGEGWLGVSASAGVAFLSASQEGISWATGPTSGGVTTTKDVPTHYTVVPVFAELALHGKLPIIFGQQPFMSVSAAAVGRTSAFSPGTLFGLDLGVVWND